MKRKLSIVLSLIIIIAFAFTSLGLTSIALKSIKLNTSSINLAIGKSYTLKVTFNPSNATNKSLIFSTANKSIATVDKKGVIKGVKAGKTVITVTGSNNLKAKCNVTVSKIVDLVIDSPIAMWIPNISEGKKKDRTLKWLEDKFNVNIIFNNVDTTQPQKAILNLAAGKSGDIVQYGGWAGSDEYTIMGAEENLFYDLNELTKKYPGRFPVIQKIINEEGYKFVNNFLYAMPDKAYGYWDYNVNNIPEGSELYNMRLMNKIGKSEKDIPKTTDELIALLRHCKKTAPGIIPLGMDARKGTRWNNFNATWFQTHGQEINGLFMKEDGTWYNAAVDPGNIPVWKLLQQLYADGLIHREIFTIENYATDVFNEGNMLVHNVFMPHFSTHMKLNLEALQKLDPTYKKEDLKVNVNPLKGPKGQVTQNWDSGSLFAKTVIPRTSKVSEYALDIVNYLCSLKGQVMAQYGIEGIHYTIDKNGSIIRNKDEWKKDQEDIYEWAPGVMPISYLHGSAWGYIKDFENNKYIDAGKTAVNVQLSAVIADAKKGDDPLLNNWYEAYKNFTKPEVVRFRPFWRSTVYTSSTMQTVNSKMTDVQNTWFIKFVIGEKDPEKDWETFVKEYNAAGAAQYLSDFQRNAAKAKKEYDKVTKIK